MVNIRLFHNDVIRWKPFPRYWPFVREIHRSPVNSPHKGQWCGALMFSLICAWINGWVNNREAGDLRRHRTHYDVTVMLFLFRQCRWLRSSIWWPPRSVSTATFDINTVPSSPHRMCLASERKQKVRLFMMTSSNGNIFRVTGHLCGEFTCHRWIPRTKARDAELWCFLWSVPE